MWSFRAEAVAALVLVGLTLWGLHWVIAWLLEFVFHHGVNIMAGVVMVVFAAGALMGGSQGYNK